MTAETASIPDFCTQCRVPDVILLLQMTGQATAPSIAGVIDRMTLLILAQMTTRTEFSQ